MATIGEATAEERKDAMRAAVDYNLPCDVRIEQHGFPVTLKSRFFALTQVAEQFAVLIEAPVQDGVVMPIRAEDTIDIFFRVDQMRYTYRTTVLERTAFTLRNGDRARALATAYPTEIIRGQRRDYYRILPGSAAPMPLRIGLLSRGSDDTKLAPAAFTLQTDVIDISASGLAFELWEEYQRNLRLHDRLLCDVTLPTGDLLALRGQIAVVNHIRGRRVIQFGVEFIDLEGSRELRVARDRLLRYIANVQRRDLRRRSRLE